MKVKVKDFSVSMELGNKGVELGIYDGDKFLGDLVVRKSGLVWCKGKKSVANGESISWKKFIKFMEED